MTDNLASKLTCLIKEFTPIFEKGIPKFLFSKNIKSDPNIFCYHYQIPDIILYKDDNFDRKECYFITQNSKKKKKNMGKGLKVQDYNLYDEDNKEKYFNFCI